MDQFLRDFNRNFLQLVQLALELAPSFLLLHQLLVQQGHGGPACEARDAADLVVGQAYSQRWLELIDLVVRLIVENVFIFGHLLDSVFVKEHLGVVLVHRLGDLEHLADSFELFLVEVVYDIEDPPLVHLSDALAQSALTTDGAMTVEITALREAALVGRENTFPVWGCPAPGHALIQIGRADHFEARSLLGEGGQVLVRHQVVGVLCARNLAPRVDLLVESLLLDGLTQETTVVRRCGAVVRRQLLPIGGDGSHAEVSSASTTRRAPRGV